MSDQPTTNQPPAFQPPAGQIPDQQPPQSQATAARDSANPAAGSFGAVFLTSFTTVFLAELGDKTQLAALLLSAESGRPVVVFIGASLALISSSLVGVLLGRWLSRVLPPQQLERLAGILMIGLGLWLGRQAAMAMLPVA
ncbi:MAG: hypothetical protein RLZZ611_1381 [Cyanobacteriota bacterium]|jgi:putative Ca2+/H+ antiporter (TMEM165/GDT1 family)